MGVVFVDGMSVFGIAFMVMFFVAICRETLPITLCRIVRLSVNEEPNSYDDAMVANAVRNVAPFCLPALAEAKAEVVGQRARAKAASADSAK